MRSIRSNLKKKVFHTAAKNDTLLMPFVSDFISKFKSMFEMPSCQSVSALWVFPYLSKQQPVLGLLQIQ